MATEGDYQEKVSYVAGADLSGSQYLFVKVTAERTVGLVTAVTDKPVGVLQNKPRQGETAEVVVSGLTKLIAAAAIAVDTAIGTDVAGKAAGTYVFGTDTTKWNLGRTHTVSGAANGILSALISCKNPSRFV